MKNKPTFSAYVSIAALGLFLVALMTGCSGPSTLPGTPSSVGDATPTTSSEANTPPTAPSAVNVTPTAPSAVNVTPTIPNTDAGATPIQLQTYTGDLFQVSYPDPWQVMIGRSNQVELGGVNKSSFDIIAQSNTAQTAEQELTAIIQATQNENTNFKSVDLQASVTIGGQSWRQSTWTGTNKSSGLSFKGRNEVVSYKGYLYIISYYALASDFDQNNMLYFQVMEQTFAFK